MLGIETLSGQVSIRLPENRGRIGRVEVDRSGKVRLELQDVELAKQLIRLLGEGRLLNLSLDLLEKSLADMTSEVIAGREALAEEKADLRRAHRAVAKTLFLERNLNPMEIAEQLGLPESTVRLLLQESNVRE